MLSSHLPAAFVPVPIYLLALHCGRLGIALLSGYLPAYLNLLFICLLLCTVTLVSSSVFIFLFLTALFQCFPTKQDYSKGFCFTELRSCKRLPGVQLKYVCSPHILGNKAKNIPTLEKHATDSRLMSRDSIVPLLPPRQILKGSQIFRNHC